jgi:anti-sigma factor NepR-like protein
MMGGEKPGSSGTDPKTTGSSQQDQTHTQGVDRPQQHDMTDKMDQLPKQDPATIDRWFDRHLSQLYSDVISEPLPKEFLELIDKLGQKTPSK